VPARQSGDRRATVYGVIVDAPHLADLVVRRLAARQHRAA
jgi:hypothetical protein